MLFLVLAILQAGGCPIGTVAIPSVTAAAHPLEINGSSLEKYDIVFVAEGYTDAPADVAAFEQKVQEAVQAISGTPPLRRCAFNFFVVRLESKEAGADHPLQEPIVCKDTPLNFQFGDLDMKAAFGMGEWVLYTWTKDKCKEAAIQATADYDLIVVIVNDSDYGGMGDYDNDLVAASAGTSFEAVLVHELGHGLGNLGDEYHTRDECYSGGEPVEPNVTTRTALPDIKWNDMITSGTPIPTTVEAAMEQLFPDLPPDAAAQQIEGAVGLWQGALDYETCAYRPQLRCMMNQCGDPFCKVCRRALEVLMDTYCPPTTVIVLPWMDVWRVPCTLPMTVRISTSPCPVPPVFFGDAPPLGGRVLSAGDEITIELQPVPGVESITLVDQTGRRIASGEAVSPDVLRLSVDVSELARGAVAGTPPFYLEFSPRVCPRPPMYEFSAAVYVNGEPIEVPGCDHIRVVTRPGRPFSD